MAIAPIATDPALIVLGQPGARLVVVTVVGLIALLVLRRDSDCVYVVVIGVVIGIIAADQCADRRGSIRRCDRRRVGLPGRCIPTGRCRRSRPPRSDRLIFDPIDKVVTFFTVHSISTRWPAETKRASRRASLLDTAEGAPA